MTIEQILALINKAAIATATGGQLTTEQARQFIDQVVSQNDLLTKIQTVQMTASKYQLNTIDIASRVMRKATEGVDPGFTQGVTIVPRELEYLESILPYDITFSFLEENIEGAGAESKINTMFAKAFGNELLDLAINGDENLAATITDVSPADGLDDTTGLSQSDHTFLRQNDGWLKIARNDSAVHAVELSASISSWKTEFKKVLKGMPNKWKGNPMELVFLVAPNVETEYRDELGERATPMGDQYVVENRRAQYQGIDVQPIPFWPGTDSAGYFPLGPVVMLTKYKNLAVGIGRNMRVGRQLQERKRIIEYTITAKTDFNYVVSDMIVLGEKA
jgi:hypothetical protein